MTCDVCDAPLPIQEGMGRIRKTCSARCHNWKHTHPGESPSWLKQRRCRYCAASLDGTDLRLKYCDIRCRRLYKTGSAVGTTRECKNCGSHYTVWDSKQTYCSSRCRMKYNQRFGDATGLRRSAEKRGADRGERFTIRDIAARDGWVCGLCLGPIDWRLRSGRNLEATVDHILPISAGGEHVLENVQLAHWTCNAAKRNSTDVAVMSVPGSPRSIMRIPKMVTDQ